VDIIANDAARFGEQSRTRSCPILHLRSDGVRRIVAPPHVTMQFLQGGRGWFPTPWMKSVAAHAIARRTVHRARQAFCTARALHTNVYRRPNPPPRHCVWAVRGVNILNAFLYSTALPGRRVDDLEACLSSHPRHYHRSHHRLTLLVLVLYERSHVRESASVWS
jgi:hypothetical protein